MLGENEFSFDDVAGDFTIRVRAQRSPLTRAEQALAKRLALALRSRLESGDPRAFDLALGLEQALHSLFPVPSSLRSQTFDSALSDLGVRLQEDLDAGRLLVEVAEQSAFVEHTEKASAQVGPRAPRTESRDTSFELRLTDEAGQAISGVSVQFSVAGEAREVSSNAAGVALVEQALASSATALLADAVLLDSVLDKRWVKPREGASKKEGNTTKVVFQGAPVGPISLKASVPNTVVLEPPLGALSLELWDKSGRVRYAGCDYTIAGPAQLSGTTDDRGQLRHDAVFPGDYQLTLDVNLTVGGEVSTKQFVMRALVLSGEGNSAQVRRVGAVPNCVLCRITGPMFETNKSFVLPGAVAHLGELAAAYASNSPGKLLLVGHADTTAGGSVNDPLSLERADNLLAYLEDQMEIWLKMYDESVPASRRWAAHEDALMLGALPDIEDRSPAEGMVHWFQRTRELKVDGVAGPLTRRQLLSEYMALDGAHLDRVELGLEITTHGCGENFPLDDTGQNVDSAPADDKNDPSDRRVELFFFDTEFGILPAAPGKNSGPGSTQYPAWRKGVVETLEIGVGSSAVADCELDLELGLSDGTVLALRSCDVHVDGKVHSLSTDAAGKLFLDALAPDDYLLKVAGFSLFVTAVKRGRGLRRLCLVAPEA